MEEIVSKIIVEGPDCSGKSTLVDRLKNRLRWDGRSLHHKEGNQFQRYLKEYALADNVVFDRSHISEEVYSQLWNRGKPFTEKEKEILDNLIEYNSIIIFTLPQWEHMHQRYIDRKFEQQIKLNELQHSRSLFENTMRRFSYLVYTSSSYAELDLLVDDIVAKFIGDIK